MGRRTRGGHVGVASTCGPSACGCLLRALYALRAPCRARRARCGRARASVPPGSRANPGAETTHGPRRARRARAGASSVPSTPCGCTSVYDAAHQRVLRPKISLERTSVMRKAQRGVENGARPCRGVILSQEVTLGARAPRPCAILASWGLHARPTPPTGPHGRAARARHARRTRRHAPGTGSGVSTPRGGPRRRRTRP
jgi:hypothetical protein